MRFTLSTLPNHKTICVWIVTILLIFAYSNSFTCSFQFDDDLSIVNNPNIKSSDLFTNSYNWFQNPNMRTFSLFTFFINYQISGINVIGFHLVNLLIHIINTILVFSLSKYIYQLSKNKTIDEFYFAISIAAIFALHPIQTQAVTYIVQRMTALAASFYLLGCICYIKFRLNCLSSNKKGIVTFLLATAICFFLGVNSKQNAVSMPFAMFAIEYLFIKPNDKEKSLFRKIITIGTIAVIIALFFVNIPVETYTITRKDYILTQIGHLSRYLQIIFFPYNQTIDHYFPTEPLPLFDVAFYIGCIIIFVSIFTFIKSSNNLIRFGIVWYFISMSVESSLIPIHDTFVEHRLYLPLFGILLIFISLINNTTVSDKKQLLGKIMLILMIGLSILTFVRNMHWQTRISIWKDAIEEYPKNPRAQNNLGYAYLSDKQYENALFYLKQSVIYFKGKDKALALNNIGKLYFEIGDKDKAFQYYKSAYQISHTNSNILNNLAEYYISQKDYDQAIIYANKSLNNYNKPDQTYYYLGEAYAGKGKINEAKYYYKKSLKYNPDFVNSSKRLEEIN